MAIKVFIRRKFPKDKNSEKELFSCIKQIRRLVPQQPGYISGEYLKSIDEIDEITTISTWFSLEDWQMGSCLYSPGIGPGKEEIPNNRI